MQIKFRPIWTMEWFFTEYILTEEKISKCTGLFTTLYDGELLNKVKNADAKRTFLQKIFGIGDAILTFEDNTIVVHNIKWEIAETIIFYSDSIINKRRTTEIL